jgi:hypothetical protein
MTDGPADDRESLVEKMDREHPEEMAEARAEVILEALAERVASSKKYGYNWAPTSLTDIEWLLARIHRREAQVERMIVLIKRQDAHHARLEAALRECRSLANTASIDDHPSKLPNEIAAVVGAVLVAFKEET